MLLAGATGAWVVAADLWRCTLECFDTGVMVMAVVVRVAVVMVVAMVMAAATVVFDSGGRNGRHINGLCGGSGAHDVSNV
jgi:hypothetical protein